MKLINGDDISTPYQCPVSAMMHFLGGKWKLIILWCIHNGVTRFGELQRAIPDISKKMLTSELRSLESDGFLNRTVFPVVPPKVVYSMTPLAESLEEALLVLSVWGERYALPKIKATDQTMQLSINSK